MKKRSLIIAFIILNILFISLFVFLWKKGIQEKHEYSILNMEQEISGNIIMKRISYYPNNRGFLFKTSCGDRFTLPFAINYNYEESIGSSFIQTKDSISKKKDSDTIFIHRDGKKYYFILGKTIEKEKLY